MASLGQGKINEIYDDEVLSTAITRRYASIALSNPVGYGCYPKNDTHRTYEGKSRNVR